MTKNILHIVYNMLVALNFLLDLLFPKFCFGCFKIGTYLCPRCEQKISFTKIPLCPYCEKPSPYGLTHQICLKPFSLDGLFVMGDYSGILRKMIHFLKYKNVFSLSETLIDLYSTHLKPPSVNIDFVAVVPLHRSRLLERGYNQAEILAKTYCRKRNLIYKQNVLTRNRSTQSQMSLIDHRKRRENILGAFSLLNQESIINKSILLFDDVATSGATIFEATKVLKRNGAKKVWGTVLARNFPN